MCHVAGETLFEDSGLRLNLFVSRLSRQQSNEAQCMYISLQLSAGSLLRVQKHVFNAALV